MTNQATLKQQMVKRAPMAASVVGMIMILGSIVFFFETDNGRIAGVTGGMLMLLGAVWYAANPFFKNRRRYLRLRSEVTQFIDLVRKLHSSTVNGQPEEIERTRSAMHEYVERMVAAAGKTE